MADCTPISVNQNENGYQINLKDYILAYVKNNDFRGIVNSGNFIFVADRLVINDKMYVEHDNTGKPCLTTYSQDNPSECCLLLPAQGDKTGGRRLDIYQERPISNCIRDGKAHQKEGEKLPKAGVITPGTQTKEQDHHTRPSIGDSPNREVFERSKELRELQELLAESIALAAEQKGSFSQVAWAQIERCHCDYKETFREKTLLSDKTFDRIKAGRLNSPDLETVMAICIGLNLGILYGDQLLKYAGFDLAASSNKVHVVYRAMLCTYCDRDIFEWNNALSEFGFPLICAKAYREIVK